MNENSRCSQACVVHVPRLERVLERSMMACLLGLLRTERLAREMSAVTRVIDILKEGKKKRQATTLNHGLDLIWTNRTNQVRKNGQIYIY